MATHNKEHACEICREVFGQTRQLRIHMYKAHGIKDSTSMFHKDISDQISISGSSSGMDWESEQTATEVLEANKHSLCHNGSNHSIDKDLISLDVAHTTKGAEFANQKLLAAKLEGVTVVSNPPEQVTVS